VRDFVTAIALLTLAACTAPPVDTQPARNPQIAAHCRLLAYREDRGWLATGLPSMLIVTAMANNRRQDIYDACLEAGE
jgi:hypothetical protein